MAFETYVNSPGHHHVVMHLGEQVIELELSIPAEMNADYFALVGHPHPLQEGTMNNKVVTTTAKAIYHLGIPVCRFNFRGVGRSSGQFDQGHAETADFIQLCREWKKIFPQAKLLLAGFSFGSFVAYQAAHILQPLGLLLIAPPIFRFDFALGTQRPDFIVMGEADEVVSPQAVEEFAAFFSPPIPIQWFPDTGHFFHGRLIALREAVDTWVKQCLNLS